MNRTLLTHNAVVVRVDEIGFALVRDGDITAWVDYHPQIEPGMIGSLWAEDDHPAFYLRERQPTRDLCGKPVADRTCRCHAGHDGPCIFGGAG